MPIESHGTVLHTDWESEAMAETTTADRPNPIESHVNLLPTGRGSLAVSIEVAWLQKLMLDAVARMSTSIAESSTDSPLYRDLLPALVDMEGFRSTESSPARVAARREHRQLESRLWIAFEADPLEDGVCHPAEEVIEESLEGAREANVLESLRVLSLDARRPDFAASVLRSLGRLGSPGTSRWRTKLIRDGLDSEPVPIRDAAIQAAELWGSPEMREVLEAHVEPVSWLREYLQDVIGDLEV